MHCATLSQPDSAADVAAADETIKKPAKITTRTVVIFDVQNLLWYLFRCCFDFPQLQYMKDLNIIFRKFVSFMLSFLNLKALLAKLIKIKRLENNKIDLGRLFPQ